MGAASAWTAYHPQAGGQAQGQRAQQAQDHPEDVQITRKVDEMGVLLTLKVNAKDMGQVVGSQGATANAIRSLLRIVGVKNHARVNLKIEEPEGSTRAQVPTQQ